MSNSFFFTISSSLVAPSNSAIEGSNILSKDFCLLAIITLYLSICSFIGADFIISAADWSTVIKGLSCIPNICEFSTSSSLAKSSSVIFLICSLSYNLINSSTSALFAFFVSIKSVARS